MAGLLPDALAEQLMEKAGVDRLHAFYLAIDIVRRGGTISLIGVYGGMADPLPMLTLFDKQIQLRMGQANVKRWVDDIMPLLDRRRPAGRGGVRHPPGAARRGAGGLREVPEEGGRRRQGAAHALVGYSSAAASAQASTSLAGQISSVSAIRRSRSHSSGARPRRALQHVLLAGGDRCVGVGEQRRPSAVDSMT